MNAVYVDLFQWIMRECLSSVSTARGCLAGLDPTIGHPFGPPVEKPWCSEGVTLDDPVFYGAIDQEPSPTNRWGRGYSKNGIIA